MKRLVVCCDGTWNKPDSENITNIEKIARTVQIDPDAAGEQQLVYYLGGVGTGDYKADKFLGGAFGFGLMRNVIACYRFLALNYEPDDEIYIFGFSRGAFTARSLAGMIGRVGLLTRLALVQNRLSDVVKLYERAAISEGVLGESIDEFRHDHCHSAKVNFLGVFDTVGALGVPGFQKFAPHFHELQLSNQVLRARHALAIDETRLKFEPTLWEAPVIKPGAQVPPPQDVKQVWFEGVHSDIGGGYRRTGLSDTTLYWMVKEAHATGLVFDVPLLNLYINSGEDPFLHDPLKATYKIDNALLKAKWKLGIGRTDAFDGGRRRLTNERALGVRVASSVVNHYLEGRYVPKNLKAFDAATNGFAGVIESVVALPEAGTDISELGKPLP
ncbi:DUF2235 domain-containing protein [Nocardioides marmorisolisilvae]|uniref:DUF2235 domain-containing protein n=1 Tax=Nocardioides marmorisolisilvae TaxID=1542737 RepID=A0A3N0DSI2_9ACTN|nr:DUF2235 domain-containing protein [Nocardioides marmorisolisilvae]RNL78471.1 DUF2235 domain-containing protein [Nocardioides marmorisolisilvae]